MCSRCTSTPNFLRNCRNDAIGADVPLILGMDPGIRQLNTRLNAMLKAPA